MRSENKLSVDIIDPVIAQVSLNMPSKNIPIAKAGDTVELSFQVPNGDDRPLSSRIQFNGLHDNTNNPIGFE